MFHRRHNIANPVSFWFEDREVLANRGDSVAGALLAVGISQLRRSPVSGSARAPFCMIGNCYECLVEIEGRGAVQACLIEVAEGMQVRMTPDTHPEPG